MLYQNLWSRLMSYRGKIYWNNKGFILRSEKNYVISKSMSYWVKLYWGTTVCPKKYTNYKNYIGSICHGFFQDTGSLVSLLHSIINQQHDN